MLHDIKVFNLLEDEPRGRTTARWIECSCGYRDEPTKPEFAQNLIDRHWHKVVEAALGIEFKARWEIVDR